MDKYNGYRVALAGVCYYCSRLAILNEKIKNGEAVYPEEVDLLCRKIASGKKALLEEKKALGFTDGLSFMEDNRFAGFWVKDGFVYGNTEKLFRVVRPMYEGFPENGNNYQYEVANYLLAFMQQKEDPVFRNTSSIKEKAKNLLAGCIGRLVSLRRCIYGR